MEEHYRHCREVQGKQNISAKCSVVSLPVASSRTLTGVLAHGGACFFIYAACQKGSVRWPLWQLAMTLTPSTMSCIEPNSEGTVTCLTSRRPATLVYVWSARLVVIIRRQLGGITGGNQVIAFTYCTHRNAKSNINVKIMGRYVKNFKVLFPKHICTT